MGGHPPPVTAVLAATAGANATAASPVGRGDKGVGFYTPNTAILPATVSAAAVGTAAAPVGHEGVMGGGYPPAKLAGRAAPAVNVLQPDVNLDSVYKTKEGDSFLGVSLGVPCPG